MKLPWKLFNKWWSIEDFDLLHVDQYGTQFFKVFLWKQPDKDNYNSRMEHWLIFLGYKSRGEWANGHSIYIYVLFMRFKLFIKNKNFNQDDFDNNFDDDDD